MGSNVCVHGALAAVIREGTLTSACSCLTLVRAVIVSTPMVLSAANAPLDIFWTQLARNVSVSLRALWVLLQKLITCKSNVCAVVGTHLALGLWSLAGFALDFCFYSMNLDVFGSN